MAIAVPPPSLRPRLEPWDGRGTVEWGRFRVGTSRPLTPHCLSALVSTPRSPGQHTEFWTITRGFTDQCPQCSHPPPKMYTCSTIQSSAQKRIVWGALPGRCQRDRQDVSKPRCCNARWDRRCFNAVQHVRGTGHSSAAGWATSDQRTEYKYPKAALGLRESGEVGPHQLAPRDLGLHMLHGTSIQRAVSASPSESLQDEGTMELRMIQRPPLPQSCFTGFTVSVRASEYRRGKIEGRSEFISRALQWTTARVEATDSGDTRPSRSCQSQISSGCGVRQCTT